MRHDLIENPPGGILARRTDAQGRIKVPYEYKDLRVMIGTECRAQGVCQHVSAAHKLDGEQVTMNVGGGLNYH